MVDVVMEHEAISGMMEVAIIKMKMELDSVLRRVQGMEVCTGIHASVTKFDRGCRRSWRCTQQKKTATVQMQPRASQLWKMFSTGRAEAMERGQEAGMPLRWSMPTGQTNGRYDRADHQR